MAYDEKPAEGSSVFLALTPDESEIATAAAGLLEHVQPLSRLHMPGSADLSVADRRALGEMGWFGLAAPEADGGSGLSAVEHALFFREVGRRCGALDILGQVLAAQTAVAQPGLRSALLSGEQGVALAVPDAGGLRIFGAPEAGKAVLVDRERSAVLDISGLTLTPRPGLDPGTTMVVAAEADAPALAERLDGEVWRLGELGAAAMLVGLAEVSLELIVEYAKVRETFGRKIGAYQAVRHPCADMAMRAEAARSQLWYAAAALKGGRADARAHLDAAKHLANEAGLANADVNIQLHGGIGVTDEHSAHLLLKRSLLLGRLFGAKRQLLDRLLHAQLLD
jgi:alkylation response protein AidB-like acyl-CoA dehydrogenase